jgi:hypothetical protein
MHDIQSVFAEERMRRALLLAGLALGACATGPSRQELMATYVGQPVTVLLAGMGVPNRTYETSGIRYLAYDEQHVDLLPSPGFYGPWGYGPYGYAWASPAFPPTIVTWGCETTFQVTEDVVRAFSLRGNAC